MKIKQNIASEMPHGATCGAGPVTGEKIWGTFLLKGEGHGRGSGPRRNRKKPMIKARFFGPGIDDREATLNSSIQGPFRMRNAILGQSKGDYRDRLYLGKIKPKILNHRGGT